MNYIHEEAISYDDVTIRPRFSKLNSRSDTDISSFGYKSPVINSPMIHTSSPAMLSYMVDNNLMTTVHRYFKSPSDQLKHVMNSVGEKYSSVYFSVGKDTAWIDHLIYNGVTRLLIDMAHGWSSPCVSTISHIRTHNPTASIIAGNVDSYDGYVDLISAGANGVRVGIASGKICSTHINTGVGLPMITALMECGKARDAVGGMLIADGGIYSGGTIAKAMCFADMVMVGSLLGATDLAEGPFYDADGLLTTVNPKYVDFFGMASNRARIYNGTHSVNASVEGVSGKNKYLGRTADVMNGLEANMRASMSYVGTDNWLDYRKFVTMQRISSGGLSEKMTHMHVPD